MLRAKGAWAEPATGTQRERAEEVARMEDSSVGAAVLIGVIAVLIIAAFITLWLRDKGRADEVATDPQRPQPDVATQTRAREAREEAADEPPVQKRERRH
jgi:hypothetical protein